ncbi:PepSY-associated TM helix domain-containing protein [Orrella sp. JC864]|uniref:PepSY-associated TM helix domain-containing protein n=1 Tax=Orrella sp. JC864 TaxID=3120298 RepID=UPI0030092A3B
MKRLRGLWLACHRWVALGLGWVLVVSGLSGALLAVGHPLDRWLHPGYFQAAAQAGAGQASLESLLQRLAHEFGPAAAFTFRPPRRQGQTLHVLVRGAWEGTLYLHPATGAELGRRAKQSDPLAQLHALHSALWMGSAGKAVLALAALAYLLLALSGIVLWWPRKWPPSLRMELRKGTLRALFDLHRSGGVALAAALALSVGSGAYLAWRPIGAWITWLAAAPRTMPPALPAGSGPTVSLDRLAVAARATFPQGRIGYFLYTPHADRPMAVRMRLPGDPHPNGRSTVWLDPRSGAVLAAHRWDELDPGARINAFVYPLHTGELAGAPGQAGVALLGLALSGLGGSGIWLWWRRRKGIFR